jgi:BirA family transcriptional regulator, biotin operon repressor / biotin---[acetyl-CoA-carboxylase] ligase
MAAHQTAGRGRLDRTWEAPPGTNLLVSFLFRRLPVHLHQLTQRVALAARAACRDVAGVEPALKWPNDLLLDGAKMAGILAEAWVDRGRGGIRRRGPRSQRRMGASGRRPVV